MIRLAINGAAGRMGRRLIALGAHDKKIKLVCAADVSTSELVGHDSGVLAGIGQLDLPIVDAIGNNPHVVIDFSSPEGTQRALDYCLSQSTPLVVATTGLSPELEQALRSSAHRLPICMAPNMSLAVNLAMKLATQAANALRIVDSGVDVEIIERHHRFKTDAPSGTALRFGSLIAEAMGKREHRHGRHGNVGQRGPQEIGYHAVRAGDDPGQHVILFGMMGETLELRVAASNRDCYAAGALQAAKFLVDQGAGMYTMFDVLSL